MLHLHAYYISHYKYLAYSPSSFLGFLSFLSFFSFLSFLSSAQICAPLLVNDQIVSERLIAPHQYESLSKPCSPFLSFSFSHCQRSYLEPSLAVRCPEHLSIHAVLKNLSMLEPLVSIENSLNPGVLCWKCSWTLAHISSMKPKTMIVFVSAHWRARMSLAYLFLVRCLWPTGGLSWFRMQCNQQVLHSILDFSLLLSCWNRKLESYKPVGHGVTHAPVLVFASKTPYWRRPFLLKTSVETGPSFTNVHG